MRTHASVNNRYIVRYTNLVQLIAQLYTLNMDELYEPESPLSPYSGDEDPNFDQNEDSLDLISLSQPQNLNGSIGLPGLPVAEVSPKPSPQRAQRKRNGSGDQ